MLKRFWKLPVVAVVFLTVGLLMGAALIPVAAQQLSGVDGQVAIRSDGAIFLISGGQRRWIATVDITDAEINAYPEAEPIYTGLAPLPAAAPAAAASPSPAPAAPAPPAQPVPAAQPAPAVPAGQPPAGQPPAPTPVPTPAPAAAAPTTGDPSLPIDVDIDGTPKFEAGDVIRVVMKTSLGASCELSVRYASGSDVQLPGTAADTRGQCKYSIHIPSSTAVGPGVLRGSVRLGGRSNQAEAPFEVVPNN